MSLDFDTYIPILAKSIVARRSIRKYLPDLLPAKILLNLSEFIERLTVPFSHHVKLTLHHIPKGKKVFYYPQPECFAAFRTQDSVQDQAKLGFCGELVILYAVSQGLSTCWMGHYWKETPYEIVLGTSETEATEIIYCTTPLGYRPEKLNLMSNMSMRLFSKKKSVEERLHPDSLVNFPQDIYIALDLACKAPSAMNNQCWRFTVTEEADQYSVKINKPRGYHHFKWPHVNIDVGTSAAHFWVSLQNRKIPCNLKIEDDGETVDWIFRIDKKHLVMPPA